jgi:hypothetical protein
LFVYNKNVLSLTGKLNRNDPKFYFLENG